MRVGLFIPCYIDQFYPQVGMATLKILNRFPEIEVVFPEAQTCCGQPMANTGCNEQTRPLAERFLELFSEFDHVVSPSGSCVSMVRHHYENYFHNDSGFNKLQHHIWELCEFLHDVMKVDSMPHPFPHRVGLHSSCHGLRELRLDSCSERMGSQVSKVRSLLELVPQIQLVDLSRPDECCGFGGTFAVAEEGVSVMMGRDRIQDHTNAGAEVITATDSSCLMHLEGLIRRSKQGVRTMHIAEILAGFPAPR
jgi:L-lactate dehydrogenase complex protein LldE